METPDLETHVFLCSRCETVIEEPNYLCKNSHLACEKCSKVFCQICRHLFRNRRGEIQGDELVNTATADAKKIHTQNPYEPNDGIIELGKKFLLPKKGLCRFYAIIDNRQYTFNWKINPLARSIEVDVSPTEIINENWFILEFFLPCDEDTKIRKEWAVNHRLLINYEEIEVLYENEHMGCRIYIRAIPFGKPVIPIEDKIRNVFSKVF